MEDEVVAVIKLPKQIEVLPHEEHEFNGLVFEVNYDDTMEIDE